MGETGRKRRGASAHLMVTEICGLFRYPINFYQPESRKKQPVRAPDGSDLALAPAERVWTFAITPGARCRRVRTGTPGTQLWYHQDRRGEALTLGPDLHVG
jgi:hypothetical protein